MSTISPLGNTPEAIWQNYLSDESLISSKKYNNQKYFVATIPNELRNEMELLRKSDIKYKALDETVLLAILVSRKAIKNAGWKAGDDFGISFDDGGDIEIPEQNIDDISTELLGSAIQRSAAQILIKAVKDEVSDIHIEPQESDFRIRLRQDGVLNKFLTILSK